MILTNRGLYSTTDCSTLVLQTEILTPSLLLKQEQNGEFNKYKKSNWSPIQIFFICSVRDFS